MLDRVRDFFINREWALFVGLVATLVTSGEEALEVLSVVASEQDDWTVLGLVPLVVAVTTRLRVWSNKAVEEVQKVTGV